MISILHKFSRTTQDHRQRFQNIAKVADIKMERAQILTREGTKCVAIPIATSSLPFNLAPVKAKNSPESVIQNSRTLERLANALVVRISICSFNGLQVT